MSTASVSIDSVPTCAPPPPPPLLTSRDVARLLGVCEKTVYNLAKQGSLPAVRIGGAVRYDPADLRAFIEGAKEDRHGR